MKPFATLDLLRTRMTEAAIAQSGIRQEGLARHLRAVLASEDVSKGCLIRPAIIEGAFPFVSAEKSLGDLSGSLLDPRTVDALVGDDSGSGYSFPRTRHPYEHQVKAWETLTAKDPRSLLVTSGTGSGKTECFLVPLLDDLYRRDEYVEGVEAIMLYPLNALIASQRERLDAWTAPGKGKLRYCLYNGDLAETASSRDRRMAASAAPQCVSDRTELRRSPPPVLVTNLTMLEYMLVRRKDAPIVAASRGRLKWIVLDEAHTLIGAAAAEVSLLLRRVMEAFEVDPRSVRFVATSATIGQVADTREQLRKFLADVGGISPDRVDVIAGERQLPTRAGRGGVPPKGKYLEELEAPALFDRLSRSDLVWTLVEKLKDRTVPRAELDRVAAALETDGERLAMALTKAKSAHGEVLAPLRVHAFHRQPAGLWSCISPDCTAKPADWPRGRILHERAEDCPSCSMPVAELVSCNECGSVFMRAEEAGNHLRPPLRARPADEFEFDAARDEDGETETETEEQVAPAMQEHCFALADTGGFPVFVDRETGHTCDKPSETTFRLGSVGDGHGPCPSCSAKVENRDKLFPFRFGAPFIMGNATPVLLEGMPASETPRDLPQQAPEKPFDGRQLISFTDSRQGTARIAAKLQIESERAFTRSLIYQAVQHAAANPPGGDGAVEIATIKAQMPNWQDVPYTRDRVRDLEQAMAAAGNGAVDWNEMRDLLGERVEVRDWLAEVWGERATIFHRDSAAPETELARALLLRELMRRPRTANSLETLGLARLFSPTVEKLLDANVPSSFRTRGGTLSNWKDWLNTVLTFTLRANSAVRVSADLLNWIMRQGRPRTIAAPGSAADKHKEQGWPFAGATAGNRPRAIEILVHGLKLNLEDDTHRRDINDWLAKAFDQLGLHFKADASGTRALDFATLSIGTLTKAHVCPVTRRLLDVAPFGLTPYARSPLDKVETVEMPRCPSDSNTPARRHWLETDETVIELRKRGLWTDVHDRIALFAPYTRSAEHSAQLTSTQLRGYEAKFKEGQINLLNCSTTMEMGVDIGSVNGIVMTNVPPSIANYRQRVGRAGRRGQPLSLAFTVAKDRPLDREAFRDPDEYLTRTMAAPRVSLDSKPIVQRHVNAFLLSRFIMSHSGDVLDAKIGEFMGCPAAPASKRALADERPVRMFSAWLGRATTAEETAAAIARLVRGSVLAGRVDLLKACADEILKVEKTFSVEWEALRGQLRGDDKIGATKAIEMHLRRLCDEFLLGDLADRGFLPGHGFPNHVVALELDRQSPGAGREDNRGRRHEGPKRPLDVAIREYAPGGEVVIDGQVFRVGGVTLNWQKPSSVEGVREVQALRWSVACLQCGATWTGLGTYPTVCRACGDDALHAEEYLKPAGFLRDRHKRAHADVDQLSFVPSETPRVSASGATWERLTRPERGRLRINRAGSVYFHSRGANGNGYGLCLRCGRMEPMQDGETTCSALYDHKPLRSRDNFSHPCKGNGQPFAIRHGLMLGHEIHTDVLELQPAARASPGAANALAIALREAIASYLGIEPDEMGFAVSPTRNELGAKTCSLFLFDRPAGGAGYVARAADELRRLLPIARKILDCHNECSHACSSCVLVSDAPEREEDLDRRAAMAFIDAHLSLPDRIADEDRIGPDADLSDRPLSEMDDWLNSRPQSELVLWSEPADIIELEPWPLAGHLRRWTDNAHPVTLILPRDTVDTLDDAQRLFLRDFAERHQVAIAEGHALRCENGASVFAAASTPGQAQGWACRDASLLKPSSKWGDEHQAPIVRAGIDLSALSWSAVDKDRLAPRKGAEVVKLDNRLEVSIESFAAKMAKLIASAIGKPRAALNTAVYRDRYARSPLVLRLLIDTVSELAGDQRVTLLIETAPDRKNPNLLRQRIWSDVEDDQKLGKLAETYGETVGLAVSVSVCRPPHKRSLTLIFSDGSRFVIDLDQGFGWLRYKGNDNGFNPTDDVKEQARKLSYCDGRLASRDEHDSQMVVRQE